MSIKISRLKIISPCEKGKKIISKLLVYNYEKN